jgi:hypothetical protein
VHLQENEEEHKKTSQYFSDYLSTKLLYFKDNYGIDAPNAPVKISFNDFMLYTRAIKYFSNILNDICFPQINNLALAALKEPRLQQKLLQSRHLNYTGALSDRVRTLRSFFHNHFGIHHKELRDEFCRAYLTNEGTDYSEYL